MSALFFSPSDVNSVGYEKLPDHVCTCLDSPQAITTSSAALDGDGKGKKRYLQPQDTSYVFFFFFKEGNKPYQYIDIMM